jgi:hypothetical protein
LGDRRKTEWNRKRFRGLIGAEVRVVIGELLDVVLDQAVNVPFEHRAVDVEAELVSDVLVDLLRVWRATHAFDTQKFEVAFLRVIETMAGNSITDMSEFWHESINGGGRHCR